MKLFRPRKKWILTAMGLFLTLLILKIVLFFTAKPKITVDYVAEYNSLTYPQNYDPNNNAADDYQRAFNAFVEMPSQVRAATRRPLLESYKKISEKDYLEMLYREPNKLERLIGTLVQVDWPMDFNDADQNALRQWMALNEQAFEFYRTASRKPYYWLERYTKKEDNYIGNILFPEDGNLLDMTEAIIWNAKLNAAEGQFQLAFEDILTCYRAGQQKCKVPSLMTEQFLGLRMKEKSLSAIVSIIDRIKVEPADLIKLQDTLQEEFKKDTYVFDYETEKLILYDKLQRIFVHNHKGTGRLIWSAAKDIISLCGDAYNSVLRKRLFLASLIGPTRNDMVRRIEDTFAVYESAKTDTPWQLHLRDSVYLKKLEASHRSDCKDCFILDRFFPLNFYYPFHKYYWLKAHERATLAIITIHRFKADKGTLPAKLDELVSDGYLQQVPLDPYSDGALVYHIDRDNFILYSIGQNFKDDGGKKDDKSLDDIIFWPVNRTEKRP
jgi:hypothetical protein